MMESTEGFGKQPKPSVFMAFNEGSACRIQSDTEGRRIGRSHISRDMVTVHGIFDRITGWEADEKSHVSPKGIS